MDRLKVLTINLWGVFGPAERRLALAQKQIEALDPDVICIQETEGWQAKHIAFPAWSYRHACHESNLAILTRKPLLDSGVRRYTNQARDESRVRKFIWTKIAFASTQLTITNTHLSWKSQNAPIRRAQAAQLAGFLRSHSPAIACGDFNCTYNSHELLELRTSGCFHTMQNFPDRSKPTWDNANPFIQTHHTRFPDRHIDLILLKDAGVLTTEHSHIVLNTPQDGLLASDHYGVLTTIRTGLGAGRQD